MNPKESCLVGSTFPPHSYKQGLGFASLKTGNDRDGDWDPQEVGSCPVPGLGVLILSLSPTFRPLILCKSPLFPQVFFFFFEKYDIWGG